MRPPRPLLFATLLLIAFVAGLAAAGCGGGGDDESASNGGGIPTATLPDPLPEPRILGQSSLPVQGETYTVQAGDSLSAIAQRFGTTVEAIAQANNLADPTSLEVGQELVIPGASAPPEEEVLPATVEPTEAGEPSGETTYTVQSGDVAALIAERFGVTTEELAAANDTTIDDLRSLSVGDVLVIPAPAPTATPPAP